ncbi:MAG: hypothetical protein Q9M25_10340 [Mariprofundaceae bacterium]|nr:hypothetical protein [Mariprofundaceae bacterium]
MSVLYTIDSKRRVVFTQVVGVVDGEQLHEHQDRLRNDPDFQADMRKLMDCLELKDAKLKTIVYSHLARSSPWGNRSRRAIVAPSALGFGLLRIFHTLMSGAHGEIAIFRDLQSAKTWLDL